MFGDTSTVQAETTHDGVGALVNLAWSRGRSSPGHRASYDYYNTLDANLYTRFYLCEHMEPDAICVARNEGESSEVAIAY